ncbi:hypothetical protein AB0C34_03510 [Nocardia sp. NPDC049220]
MSGNHINPVVALELAASGRFPWRRIPAYFASHWPVP